MKKKDNNKKYWQISLGICLAIITVGVASGNTYIGDSLTYFLGSVGIGTSSPGADLEVEGTTLIDMNEDSIGLTIDTEATTLTKAGLKITADQGSRVAEFFADTTNAYTVINNAASGVGGNWFYRNIDSATTAGPLVFIEQDHASDDQDALSIQNDGTGKGLFIDHNGATGRAIEIDTESASAGFYLDKAGTSELVILGGTYTDSSGSNRFYRNLASSSTAGPVMNINNANAGDDQNALYIEQDSPVSGLYVDQDGEAQGVRIYSSATTAGESSAALSIATVSGATALHAEYVSNTYGFVTLANNPNAGQSASFYFYRNLANTDTDAPVMRIKQDHGSDDQDALVVEQDGTGLHLSLAGTGATCASGDYGFMRNSTGIYTCFNGEATSTSDIPGATPAVEGYLGEVRMFALSMTGAVTKAALQAAGWAICDGTTPASQGISSPTIETTPNLEDKFLRMSDDETSGSTGGAATHTHTIVESGSGPGDKIMGGNTAADYYELTTGSSSNLPPYYEVAYFMKVK